LSKVPLLIHGTSRRRLLDLSVGLVEDVQAPPAPDGSGPRGVSREFQVALPYRGLVVWHVGHDAVVGDANQVLFVAGGEPYRISDPVTTGYAELIVTPEPSVLGEIAGVSHDAVAAHPLFRHRSRRADPRLQVFRARVLSWANGAPVEDPLAAEELVIALLRSALHGHAPPREPAASTRRLVRRAKEFLEAQLANRIRLVDVARTVGASPAYLTHVSAGWKAPPRTSTSPSCVSRGPSRRSPTPTTSRRWRSTSGFRATATSARRSVAPSA
jgi:hypothetical protein